VNDLVSIDDNKRRHYIEDEEEDEEYDYGIYNNQQLFNAGYGEEGRFYPPPAGANWIQLDLKSFKYLCGSPIITCKFWN
jgi:hypothetical protein